MCIFCKIVAGEIPARKIYEDENTLAFLDVANDCYGHILVIPKTHCENMFDISKADASHFMETVRRVMAHIKALGFEGANIVNNNGEIANQKVLHLHFHIFPREGEKAGPFERYYPQNIQRDFDAEHKLFKMN